jgi:hypothetical protein
MVESSAVMAKMALLGKEPTFARGKMWNLAMIREELWWPMP